MKKKYIERMILVVFTVIIISNTPPIRFFIGEKYHYQNKDGSFEFTEQSGPTQGFDIMLKRFENFKTENPENPAKTLYRTFKIKPWKFWEWYQIIKNYDRFELGYIKKTT